MMESKPISVKKFGGTSVGTIERIHNVARRVVSDPTTAPIVVVSAMAGETNRLVGLGEQTFPGYRGAAYDLLVASGEQVSVALVVMALEKLGHRARPYLAHQLGIKTDSMFSKARIQSINTDSLREDLRQGVIPVIAGFQGVDDDMNVTTLGRGGSDTSAVAIAAALQANECEIYTDVPAVFSADPRLVKDAREIKKLSFEEMMEMASLGSKVLHVRSVEIGAKYGVRIHLRSSFEMREGTWVVPEGEIMETPLVSAVTHEATTAVLKLYPLPEGPKVLADLFGSLAKKGVVVDIITQSQGEHGQRLAFSVPLDDLSVTQQVVQAQFPDLKTDIMTEVSKVSIVGVGMRNHPGVAARFFSVLAEHQIPIHLVTTSEIKVSAVIDRAQLEKAAQSLHSIFALDAQ